MGTTRRITPYIIIEKGRQQYSREKMQSANIFMEIMDGGNSPGSGVAKLPPVRNKRADVAFYLMGSDTFCDQVRAGLKRVGFRGRVSQEYQNENDCMAGLGLNFPAAACTETREPAKRSSALRDALDRFGTVRPDGIPDEDFAAVILAAEELKGYQICPPAPENIRKALVKKTEAMVQDPERAETAVKGYLQALKTMHVQAKA